MTPPRLDEGSEREAFEAWAKQYGRIFLARQPHGPYMHAFTQEAWVGWKARAALSTGRLGGEWLPIETAPKDGKPIILGFAIEEEYGGFVAQGRWHEEDHDGPDNMGHDAGFMDDQFDFFKCARSFGNPAYQDRGLQPTHWQPMPPTPAAQPQGDKSHE